MANESLLITMLPDGTYHVKETEPAGDDDPGEQPIDQSVQSPDDVMQLVQGWLSSDQDDAEDAQDGGADDAAEGDGTVSDAMDNSGGDGGAAPMPAKAAWNAEASKRDPVSGLRK